MTLSAEAVREDPETYHLACQREGSCLEYRVAMIASGSSRRLDW
jgi:hypothetical protein